METLNGTIVHDPLYGFALDQSVLTEHNLEPPLTREEVRLNRDAKRVHPVYNEMAFPDRLDRAVRAITATCTRVCRESIVIRTSTGKFRRLSLRERACLQGFPITYQFYGRSYSEKLEMIGNAIPPLFVYYLGCALNKKSARELRHPDRIRFNHKLPAETPSATEVTSTRKRYPTKRRFRAAIPFLRFRTGVRFELSNQFEGDSVSWRVTFVFGNSKDIRILRPDGRQNRQLENLLRAHRLLSKVNAYRKRLAANPANVPASLLQKRWTHLVNGAGPHALVRALSTAARKISVELMSRERLSVQEALQSISALRKARKAKREDATPLNKKKFENNAAALLAGLIVASWYNSARSIRSNRLSAWPRRRQGKGA